jgi:hypothetical protein
MTGLRLAVALVFALGTAGCVPRDGRNSDCRWPAEASNHSADARHISADAEFAEDLAIRYADTHFGRRNPSEGYGAKRDRCMTILFEEIANEHGVKVEQVSSSLGRNRASIDAAEILPFALLYGLAAVSIARMTWRRYSPDEHGWTRGITMALFVSFAFAAGSTMLGEVWIWFAEWFRMGNEHMSYRGNRLFWARHRFELFAGALMIFWLAVIDAARRLRLERSSGR